MSQNKNYKILSTEQLKIMKCNRYQNLRNIAKVVLRGKIIALSADIRKTENFKINELHIWVRKKAQNEISENGIK